METVLPKESTWLTGSHMGGKSGTELLSDSSALLGAQLPTIHSAMLRKDWTAGVTAPHSTGCRYSPLGSRYCLPR